MNIDELRLWAYMNKIIGTDLSYEQVAALRRTFSLNRASDLENPVPRFIFFDYVRSRLVYPCKDCGTPCTTFTNLCDECFSQRNLLVRIGVSA